MVRTSPCRCTMRTWLSPCQLGCSVDVYVVLNHAGRLVEGAGPGIRHQRAGRRPILLRPFILRVGAATRGRSDARRTALAVPSAVYKRKPPTWGPNSVMEVPSSIMLDRGEQRKRSDGGAQQAGSAPSHTPVVIHPTDPCVGLRCRQRRQHPRLRALEPHDRQTSSTTPHRRNSLQ